MASKSIHARNSAQYRKCTYHSGLEDAVGKQIESVTGTVAYETHQIEYEVPARKAKYTPDFVLSNCIIVETKGVFDVDDRQKHLLIKEQLPHLDIRFVFTNPNAKLYKNSPTSYAAWCEKHGFQYAKKTIPQEWFLESAKETKGLIAKCRKNTN